MKNGILMQAQQLNERDLLAFIKALGDFVCIKDAAGKWLMANDAALNFFHLEGFSFFGKTDLELAETNEFVACISETCILTDQRAWEAATTVVAAEAVRRPDGTMLTYNIRKVPIFHADGSRKALIVIGEDITGFKRTEKELRNAKLELESFIALSSDAIGIADLKGNVLNINRSFEKIYGWSLEEVAGQKIPTVPDSLRNQPQEFIRRIQSGETVSGVETLRMRKDGSLINVSLSISPIRDASGNIVAVAGVSRDITKQKKGEALLRENEAKYRFIAENMSDLILVLDEKGMIKYASPSHESALGQAPEMYEGRSVFEFIHPDDIPKVINVFKESGLHKPSFQLECRCIHQAGRWLTMEAHATLVIDCKGEIEQIVLVVRDITERKNMEELLRKSDKLSMVGQLAAGVAHEIRNPLTALKGFTQLLEKSTDPHKGYFSIMMSELNRIELIVNEFLFLAKPQSVKFQKKDLQKLILHSITLLETQAILNNVQIHTDLDPDLPPIDCAENQIKQVFINLLKNAVEAMPKGGKIYVNMKRFCPGQISISVTDEGCGIPEEMIKRMGEPFFTTKEKGTGLGLVVSQKIIENHQGILQIHSEKGKGTTVQIFLPVDMKPF